MQDLRTGTSWRAITRELGVRVTTARGVMARAKNPSPGELVSR
jgi:hypothetical protein